MLGQFQRHSDSHYTQYPRNIDNFMFGSRPAPVPRRSMPGQRFNPTNLLNNQQISKGINGFSGILDNVQQALRIVETTTPLIKEYGPMVKNLPAMYRMMKAFKEINNEPDGTKETEEAVQKNSEKKLSKEQSKAGGEGDEPQQQKRQRTGVSTPKLYI